MNNIRSPASKNGCFYFTKKLKMKEGKEYG